MDSLTNFFHTLWDVLNTLLISGPPAVQVVVILIVVVCLLIGAPLLFGWVIAGLTFLAMCVAGLGAVILLFAGAALRTLGLWFRETRRYLTRWYFNR